MQLQQIGAVTILPLVTFPISIQAFCLDLSNCTRMENRFALQALDQLELLTIDQHQEAFPAHFHETFCISLVRSGVEQIQLEGQDVYGEAGAVTLTNPFEIHANPLVDEATAVSFDTLYLSQELMDHYVGRKGVFFADRLFHTAALSQSFLAVRQHLFDHQSPEAVDQQLRRFLQTLAHQAPSTSYKRGQQASPAKWAELIPFIESRLEAKASVDQLAWFMGMDKYHFARQFKSRYGLSPMHYVLMKKVFAAKQEIGRETNLTALAYQFAFADQAHFSKTFKRFVGMSPRQYKQQKKQ